MSPNPSGSSSSSVRRTMFIEPGLAPGPALRQETRMLNVRSIV